MEIRPVDPSTHEDIVRLRMERLPRLRRSNATWLFEHGDLMEILELRSVYVDGELVATGNASRGGWFPQGMAMVGVTVACGHERQGIGGALYRALIDTLPPAIDRIGLTVEDDDPESLAIAQAHGFEVVQHGIDSELALVDLPQPVAVPGVTYESAPDLEFPDEEAVEAMLLDSQTNPEAAEGFLSDLGTMRKHASSSPRPLAVVARLDGVPAAIIVGGVKDGVLDIAYTGVGRAFRGRNLAFGLKQFAHLVAADAGAQVSETTNEAGNKGIRHVNAKLGYRIVRGAYRLRGPRTPVPAVAR